jgi:hypothetical protein
MLVVQYNGDAIRQTILQEKAMKKLLVAVLALLFLTACSSEPSKPATAEKPQPKAPETITGSSAFYKCYIAARGWAQDAQPFRAESQLTPDSKGRDGKAGSWRVSFASPALRSAKPCNWVNGEISLAVEDSYSPTNSSTQVFNVQFLKVDTDKALEAAQKHGGEKLLEKQPDTPVLWALDWNRQTNELIWHVIYGTSRDSAKLRVAVNATTGEFLREEK